MKRKRKTTIRILALFLTVVLMVTGAGIENVSAFWNIGNPEDGTYRPAATITIELMKCYHKDKKDPEYSKHYDSNGNHVLSSEAIKQDRKEWKDDSENNKNGSSAVKTITRTPRVNNDTAAGTALPDANKYIYEYEMSYDESEQVDYAVITQPEITHYSDSERAKYPGLREDHVRMYWVGEYDESITKLKDAYIEDPNDSGHVIPGTDGDIGWFDFKGMCYPTINHALSQQTWETVGDHEAFQDKKSFVMTQKYGENGQQFLYLLEGTKMVGADGGFYDITKNDKSAAANNHRGQQDTGVPDGYGGHVYALIGLVFYHSLEFDANGGELAVGSVSDIQVYNGSNKGKLFTWYNDPSKERWYSDIDVAAPQAATPYGTASVKAPIRPGYSFLGWYAPELDGSGNFIYKSDGTIKLSDVPVYDTDGRAVLTYTDSSGQTKASPYFDSNGRWIYKGNVTACAKWEEVGFYTLHYDKGESNNYISMPEDDEITVNTGHTVLADSSYITGSDYIVDFKVYTNNGNQAAGVIQPVIGRFPFSRWRIGGTLYDSGDTYSNPNAAKGDTLTATAVYDNVSLILPSTKSDGYNFEGWYDSYDSNSGTFGSRVGGAGEPLTLLSSENSETRILYAKWSKADMKISFDYNLPKTATTSRLGYVILGNGVTSKTVQLMEALGPLPAPTLTGYRLNTSTSESIRSDGWSTKPNIIDDNGEEKQVNVPVYSGTLYDGSYDTLYAQWEPTWYTINYNLDGGSVSHENPKEYINYYKEITINSPTRDGSTFLGWDITGMDGNVHIIDGKTTDTGLVSSSGVGRGKTSINVTGLRADNGGTVTFTALWQDTRYSIAYDYRDSESNAVLTPASAPGNPSGYDRNTPAFTLNNPDVKGYHFTSWGGTGLQERLPSVTIQQGSSGNRRYTAYFMPAEYEILYELSGGSWGAGASHPDRAKYNRSFNVSHPVMEGCDFAGWEITRMCDDCDHKAGNSIITGTGASEVRETSFMNLRCNSAEKVLFTAKWSHAVYDIRYELNGGSFYSGGSYPASAETYTVFDINNPVRNGCTFAGWTISGMDKGLHYLPSGDTYAETKSGVGTGKADGMALAYGNLRYSSGTVTFKAAWVHDSRQLAFFGNGGTMTDGSMKDVTDDWTLRFINFGSTAFFGKYEYDTTWGTDVPAVSKTGYTFSGYYDSLSGGNRVYGSTYAKESGLYWDDDSRWIGPSLILYAQFIPDSYTVTFNTNGGYWTSDSLQDSRSLGVTYDSTKNNKAYGQTDLYRPGYTFTGWGTNPDGTGHAVYDINGYNTDEGGYWSENYRK
ncbi:MAG: InlB B-repeat-containing protein [Lachnospiraceae bacterium]